MSISNPSEGEKTIERQGIQALYTFTPFKLLRSKPGEFYTILLTPLSGFINPANLDWRSKSWKKRFKVLITPKFSKYIIHPYELYPKRFSIGSQDIFIYVRENVEMESNWKYPPTYIEFSYQSLNSGYHCMLGWTLLSSKERCPQEKYCPYRRGSPCKFYYRSPISYISLFNVYSRIQTKFEDPEEVFVFSPILAIRYKEKPLAIFKFTNQGRFVSFIDGVIFSPKRAQISIHPIVFLKDGLGFEINNIHAIEIEFLPKVLEQFIGEILSSNDNILSWIILKYHLYINISDSQELIREENGFEAFKELDRIVESAISKNKHEKSAKDIIEAIRNRSIKQDIIDYACVLFLHSLAHILKNALVARYGCKAEDIGYYIEHPKLHTIGIPSGKVRIVLFETAIGGFGYIRSLVDEIRNTLKTSILEELISAALISFRKSCEEKVEKKLKNLEKELKPFEVSSERLVRLILRAYRDTFPNTAVYPHVNSIRKAISENIEDLSENERSMLDDLLAKGPHCWDGCQLCVMMERGCNFLPFDQPFLVSERLTSKALEIILDMLKKPISSSPLKRGIREEFEDLLSIASSEVDLVSPWISPEIVERFIQLSREKNLKIRILTKIDKDNRTQQESIEKMKIALKELPDTFEVRILDELHGKGMLIDDIILLSGSFNFTLSGLNENIENVIVNFNLSEIKEFKNKFNEWWVNSKPLA